MWATASSSFGSTCRLCGFLRLSTFDASTVRFVIPAGTLTAGSTYQAQLEFFNLSTLDRTTIPGSDGIAGFGTQVSFAIAANAAVATPSDYKRHDGGGATVGTAFTFQVTGEQFARLVRGDGLPPGLSQIPCRAV